MWQKENTSRFAANDNVIYNSRGTDPGLAAECRNLFAINADICSTVAQKL
jgi:hypothetical protein